MVIFKSRCYNGGNKHNFVPRYDEKPSELKFSLSQTSAKEIRTLKFYTVYIQDVCVWCGKTVERKT